MEIVSNHITAIAWLEQSKKDSFHKNGVALGAIVKLNVDYRTHCHASALIGIVFGFKPETGGVTVCCEHGVITHDGSRNPYYVPVDKYAVIAKPNKNIPISKELVAV